MSTYVAKHPFHTASIVIITLAISVNAFAFTFTDSFTGTAINSAIWTSGQSSGDTVTFNTASGTVDMYQGTTSGSASLSFLYALTGDFVIEADYTAANWDLTGMDQQRIGIVGSQSSNYISVQRVSDWWFGGEIYLTYENGSSWNSGSPTTTDTQGRIRLVRTGSEIKGYYWDKAANGGLGNWACATQDIHPISFSGPFSFSLSIWSGYNGTQIGNVISWDNVSVTSNGIVSDAGSMSIQKCTVAAGKPLDSISFSGTLDATEADFTLAMGDVVEVGIESDLMSGISFQFPINDATFKKGKFKYSESSKGSTYAFSYDTKKGSMAFSAKNVNLNGLACPITATVTIGNYEAEVTIDETVVNGTKPCPQVLFQGFANNLTVDKYSFKPGKAAGQDSFTITGIFTAAGAPLPGQDFTVIIGSQTFSVDDSAFAQKKPNVYTCTNVPVNRTNALMSTMLDYNKCTYTLTVKNASLSQFGTLPVKLEVFGYTLNGDNPVHFNRKTKNVTEIEICTEYDYGQPDEDDDEFGFSIDITTDSTVSSLEIKWPSGQTYLIPNNDYGSTAPFNGGWREVASEYDVDEDSYDWWYWIWFDSTDDLLNNMEDGLYEFTFYFNDLTTQKTTVWFGIPKTSNPIPQPTQKPVFTSFDDYDLLTSPVPFQWEPCTDPAVKTIWLELYGDYDGDYDPDYEKELNITKTTTTGIKPLALKPGRYEAELDFDVWYEFQNADGIPVEVGKYSECDYYFEVD